ncbi:TPA: hypothetical protein ACGFAJ_003812, partial [Serratia marcescens]
FMWLYFVGGELGKVCFMVGARCQWLLCANSGSWSARASLKVDGSFCRDTYNIFSKITMYYLKNPFAYQVLMQLIFFVIV